MCKEMLVIPVNKVVDRKEYSKKWKAEEEERHKGSLNKKKIITSARTSAPIRRTTTALTTSHGIMACNKSVVESWVRVPPRFACLGIAMLLFGTINNAVDTNIRLSITGSVT
jgi:hypothetical protein